MAKQYKSVEVINVEDKEILALYLARSEDAIRETECKYGKLCRSISFGILHDRRDCEECLNDTWLAVWNTVPPKEPNPFRAYLCRIVKNLSIKKYEYTHAKKRRGEYEASLDELADCIGSGKDVEDRVVRQELVHAIDRFLSELPKEKRILFLRRYWFLHPLKDIAGDCHISEKALSMRLSRVRAQLKESLVREGFI